MKDRTKKYKINTTKLSSPEFNVSYISTKPSSYRKSKPKSTSKLD